MGSVIRQFESNESALLMYLADELPPEDRRRLDSALAQDAGLQARLADLRQLQSSVFSKLAALDVMTCSTDSRAVTSQAARSAGKQVGFAVRQWEADRLAAEALKPAMPRERRRYIGRWVYPVAAAAALLIGSLIWLERAADVPRGEQTAHGGFPSFNNRDGNRFDSEGQSRADADQVAERLRGSLDGGDEDARQTVALSRSLSDSPLFFGSDGE